MFIPHTAARSRYSVGVFLASPVYTYRDNRLLFVNEVIAVFRPRPPTSSSSVVVVAMLIIAGVELNPGPREPTTGQQPDQLRAAEHPLGRVQGSPHPRRYRGPLPGRAGADGDVDHVGRSRRHQAGRCTPGLPGDSSSRMFIF